MQVKWLNNFRSDTFATESTRRCSRPSYEERHTLKRLEKTSTLFRRRQADVMVDLSLVSLNAVFCECHSRDIMW